MWEEDEVKSVRELRCVESGYTEVKWYKSYLLGQSSSVLVESEKIHLSEHKVNK